MFLHMFFSLHRFWHKLSILAALGLLAGCAGAPKSLGDARGTLVATDSLPKPDHYDDAGQMTAYKLGADDLLQILIPAQETPEIPRVRIDKSGRLSVPVIGVIDASGLTLAELELKIEERLKAAYYRQPQVSVALLEADSARVTVEGAVRKPGIYPALANMTLVQAVASAEGTTDDARAREVVVFRTVNGQKYGAMYDLKAIRRGNYPDPQILQGDIVVVGDSAARRLFRDLLQVIPLFTTPIIVALQQ